MNQESKSLSRLIANLESDPDIQKAVRAKPAKQLTTDRLNAVKDAVFQKVQHTLATRPEAAATESAHGGAAQRQNLESGTIVWIGSFATSEGRASDLLAAAAGPSRIESKIFDIPDRRLRLLFEDNGRTVLCTVLDPNDVPSRDLAGAIFVDSIGNTVAKINGSQARLNSSDVSKGITLQSR